MKQTAWLTAILGAIVGAIVMSVFTPAPDPVQPVVQPDYAALQEQNEALISDLFYSQMRVDSLQDVIYVRDSTERRLKKDIKAYELMLNDSAKKIKELAREMLSLVSTDHKDSVCDDLATTAELFANLYFEYRDKYDSLTVTSDSTKMDLKAQNQELTKMVADLKTANLNLFNTVTGKIVENADLQRSVKRQKLKTTVVALLGILGTGAALFK